MNEIVDLRNNFVSPQVYAIYSACMYMPTWKKFCKQANVLIGDDLVRVFGYIHNHEIIGILAIRTDTKQNAEIKGIAVGTLYRQKGIGRQLIEFVFQTLQLKYLLAETDDAAILFYKRCGFEIEEIFKLYEHKEYRRYKCTLEKL